jgi:hypothetical protein
MRFEYDQTKFIKTGKVTNLYQYVNNNLKANITILRQFISSVFVYPFRIESNSYYCRGDTK